MVKTCIECQQKWLPKTKKTKKCLKQETKCKNLFLHPYSEIANHIRTERKLPAASITDELVALVQLVKAARMTSPCFNVYGTPSCTKLSTASN